MLFKEKANDAFNLNTPGHSSSRLHASSVQMEGELVLERRPREESSWCPATKIDRSISSEKDDYELKPYGLAQRNSR